MVGRRLRARGWRILALNARTRYGEIDLIGLDGGVLVFVEVKAGRDGSAIGAERPVLAVGPAKQRRVRALAGAWLGEQAALPPHREVRFDAVGVSFDRRGDLVGIEHIEA